MTSYLFLSISFSLLAFQLTDGVVSLFSVLIVQLVTIIMFVLKDRSDKQIRKEEREERAELARITAEGLAAVKVEGGNRESRIMKEVRQVKQVAIAGVKEAKTAFKEANGVNAKIVSLGQQLTEAPQQVEIMNTPNHPVPVTTEAEQ